jgi:hypothetical protein
MTVIPTRKHERFFAFLRESTNRQAFRCRIFAANMPPLMVPLSSDQPMDRRHAVPDQPIGHAGGTFE